MMEVVRFLYQVLKVGLSFFVLFFVLIVKIVIVHIMKDG